MRISTRLFAWIMLIFTVFVAIVIIVDTTLMNYLYVALTEFKLYNIDVTISEMYHGPQSEYLPFLRRLEFENNISLEIINPQGVLYYSSDSTEAVYGPETDQSLKRSFGREDEKPITITHWNEKTQKLDIERQTALKTYTKADQSTIRFLVDEMTLENGYTLITYNSLASIKDGSRITLIVVILTMLIMTGFALIFVRKITKRMTRPLNDIIDITHDISMRDFSKRCPPSNTIEIDTLSQSVNALSESLAGAIEELEEKNAQLQADYEKEKELEEVRTEFITGVSHELKTPIAIIRGYAEGLTYLVDSDPAAAKQYSETIVGETERMNDLVMRLLEILKYESGDYQANDEFFDVRELVQDWFSRNTDVLAGKGIRYENEIPEGLIGRGDSMLISSVVNNLLSNGVSHIDGEKILRAEATELDGRYRVYLFNTGKNIAEKDLDMIWNSFYRADKSMSRKEGRFGLGLTIVASIQKLHHMEYGVENMPDGVRFWFDVRKN
ncbi:MAG: HAMP domain-containing histidine kinase [Clostridia bacterium]|nr:HAMP domain-containing histidine kinase [Clostridia bacterium]